MQYKVSAVMTTYRRFKCVQRAINCFLNQDYEGPKELIVFNTDEEYPYHNMNITVEVDEKTKITYINNGIDRITMAPYTNVGAIRRDALTHASGDYVITWDDDDIFLPYFIRQGIDRMSQTGLPSFKPEYSFFGARNRLELVKNTMEASVIADINKVREYGYLLETGKEGLGWYTKMRDNKELDENDSFSVPAYCFNWSDGDEMDAPHKQSGDIDNPNNFNNHKEASRDIVTGPVRIFSKQEMEDIYSKYKEFFIKNQERFNQDLYNKYITSFL